MSRVVEVVWEQQQAHPAKVFTIQMTLQQTLSCDDHWNSVRSRKDTGAELLGKTFSDEEPTPGDNMKQRCNDAEQQPGGRLMAADPPVGGSWLLGLPRPQRQLIHPQPEQRIVGHNVAQIDIRVVDTIRLEGNAGSARQALLPTK